MAPYTSRLHSWRESPGLPIPAEDIYGATTNALVLDTAAAQQSQRVPKWSRCGCDGHKPVHDNDHSALFFQHAAALAHCPVCETYTGGVSTGGARQAGFEQTLTDEQHVQHILAITQP